MLSDTAKHVGLILRDHVGSKSVGVGPERSQLFELFSHLDPREVRSAFEELAAIGFLHIEKVIALPATDIPSEFVGIAGVSILEPFQQYYDDLGV